MSTWLGEMTDTVTVADVTGADGAAKPTYGTQSEVACFYVDGAKVTRDADGNLADVTSVFYTHTQVAKDAAIWVAGTNTANDAEARTPVAVTRYHDLTGEDDLWEVEL